MPVSPHKGAGPASDPPPETARPRHRLGPLAVGQLAETGLICPPLATQRNAVPCPAPGQRWPNGPARAARLPALNVAHYQLKFGALPLEHFADMLRAQTINLETVELLMTGMQPFVGGLRLAMGLDEDHGATDIH